MAGFKPTSSTSQMLPSSRWLTSPYKSRYLLGGKSSDKYVHVLVRTSGLEPASDDYKSPALTNWATSTKSILISTFTCENYRDQCGQLPTVKFSPNLYRHSSKRCYSSPSRVSLTYNGGRAVSITRSVSGVTQRNFNRSHIALPTLSVD